MDREGRDVDLIIPGTFSTAITAIDDVAGARALRRVPPLHRRLLLGRPDAAEGDDPGARRRPGRGRPHEIRRLAGERCVAAVTVVLPEGLPVDDPDLHPIWAAMGDADLPLLHHSFFYEPPYFPGYRDVWGHVALARAAAHPWGAQRLLGYLILSGLLDQFPQPADRLRRVQRRLAAVVAGPPRGPGRATCTRRCRRSSASPRGYAEDGRIFCGVELYEGEETVRSIIEVIGDDTIMYQSDYPHDQCAFPKSPDTVLGVEGPRQRDADASCSPATPSATCGCS